MKHIKSAFSILLLVSIFLASTVVYGLPFLKNTYAWDSSQIDVWWPTSSAPVNGVQPFKALLKNNSVENYKMFWAVDGGQWNWMDNNYQDYPHKQATVDLSGWNWHGSGPYTLSFIVQDNNGTTINQRDIQITIPQTNTAPAMVVVQPTSTPAVVTPIPTADATVAPTVTPTAAPSVSPTVVPVVQQVSNGQFFVNPNSLAKQTADSWRNSRPDDAALMDKVAAGAESYWIGGWNADVKNDVANFTRQNVAAGATPVFIAYNIPQRDCSGYSAGGANNSTEYQNWINNFAQGIGSAKSIVVLEPDSVSLTDCLSASDKVVRNDMLKYAVQTFKSLGNTTVYIDAGHPLWIDAAEMANRLNAAGIAQADGFSLNVSSFYTTQQNIDYGTQLSGKLGGKHFVIDTSRNGQGATADNQWCNPSGRGLGTLPTTNTGNALVDAFLWLKKPGESDGTCNGGPSAGVWWPEYALGLAKNANW